MLLHGCAGSRRGPGAGVVQVSEPADDVLRQPAKGWGAVAQVSELGENLLSAECGVRSAECGVRSAECGVRSAECGVRNAECGPRRECGVRPAGVCGAGRCLRSAECGSSAECGLQTAGPADVYGARNAEYCGLVRSFVV